MQRVVVRGTGAGGETPAAPAQPTQPAQPAVKPEEPKEEEKTEPKPSENTIKPDEGGTSEEE